MIDTSVGRPNNPYLGTWRLMSATLSKDGVSQPTFGESPLGLLSFTEDMHFVEVLMDSAAPAVASGQMGQGTDEENRALAMKTLGIFGTYEVGMDGTFVGNRVQGCTFPNWIGDVRTQKDITLQVHGNQLVEKFHQPGGATVDIVWERAVPE